MKLVVLLLSLLFSSLSYSEEISRFSIECPKIFKNQDFVYRSTEINKSEWEDLSLDYKKSICRSNINKKPKIDWSKKQDLAQICSFYYHKKLKNIGKVVTQDQWNEATKHFSPVEICENNIPQDKTEEKRIRSKIKNLITNTRYEHRMNIFYAAQFKEDPMAACNMRKKVPNALSFVDQEGGFVVRIKDKDATPITPKDYDNYTVEEIYQDALKVAKKLKEYCIDVNLAPVIDKNSRAYEWYATNKIEYIAAFAQGMKDGGIVPTFKHFPGCTFKMEHAKNSYNNIYNDKIEEAMICKEIHKGEVLEDIKHFGLDKNSIVMMSNNTYPNYSYKPAPVEKLYYDWLRNDLGHEGLVITDALEKYNLNKDFVLTVFRLSDIILTSDHTQLQFMEDTLWDAYENGLITEEYIDKKKDRIDKFFKNFKN